MFLLTLHLSALLSSRELQMPRSSSAGAALRPRNKTGMGAGMSGSSASGWDNSEGYTPELLEEPFGIIP